MTVDDAAFDTSVGPFYLPSSDWWKQGSECSGCGAQPDSSQTFNHTWHDTTFTPGDGVSRAIEVSFTGMRRFLRCLGP